MGARRNPKISCRESGPSEQIIAGSKSEIAAENLTSIRPESTRPTDPGQAGLLKNIARLDSPDHEPRDLAGRAGNDGSRRDPAVQKFPTGPDAPELIINPVCATEWPNRA